MGVWVEEEDLRCSGIWAGGERSMGLTAIAVDMTSGSHCPAKCSLLQTPMTLFHFLASRMYPIFNAISVNHPQRNPKPSGNGRGLFPATVLDLTRLRVYLYCACSAISDSCIVNTKVPGTTASF